MAIEHWKEKVKGSGEVMDPVEQERLRLEQMKKDLEDKKNAIEEKLKLLSGKPIAKQLYRIEAEEVPQSHGAAPDCQPTIQPTGKTRL